MGHGFDHAPFFKHLEGDPMVDNMVQVVGAWLLVSIVFSFGVGFAAGRYFNDEQRMVARVQGLRDKAQRVGRHPKGNRKGSRHFR